MYCLFEKTENKQKEAGVAHIFKKKAWIDLCHTLVHILPYNVYGTEGPIKVNY